MPTARARPTCDHPSAISKWLAGGSGAVGALAGTYGIVIEPRCCCALASRAMKLQPERFPPARAHIAALADIHACHPGCRERIRSIADTTNALGAD